MAPEVIRGQYTSKADIWSIGVITYMLLSSHMVSLRISYSITLNSYLSSPSKTHLFYLFSSIFFFSFGPLSYRSLSAILRAKAVSSLHNI